MLLQSKLNRISQESNKFQNPNLDVSTLVSNLKLEPSYKDILTNENTRTIVRPNSHFYMKKSHHLVFVAAKKSRVISKSTENPNISEELTNAPCFYDKITAVLNEIYPNGYSATVVAKETGVTRQWISRILSCQSKTIPSLDVVLKIIFAYKIPPKTAYDLIALAGHSLNTGTINNNFIIFCINNQAYSLEAIRKVAEKLNYVTADLSFHPHYSKDR